MYPLLNTRTEVQFWGPMVTENTFALLHIYNTCILWSSIGFQSRHIQQLSSSAMFQCCRHYLFLAIHFLTELKWLFCWQNQYWVVGIFRVFCFFIKTVRLSWRGGVGMAWRWMKIIMLVVNQGRCSIRISSHVFVNCWTIHSFVTAAWSFTYIRKRFCLNYQTNTLTGWVSSYFYYII